MQGSGLWNSSNTSLHLRLKGTTLMKYFARQLCSPFLTGG